MIEAPDFLALVLPVFQKFKASVPVSSSSEATSVFLPDEGQLL